MYLPVVGQYTYILPQTVFQPKYTQTPFIHLFVILKRERSCGVGSVWLVAGSGHLPDVDDDRRRRYFSRRLRQVDNEGTQVGNTYIFVKVG